MRCNSTYANYAREREQSRLFVSAHDPHALLDRASAEGGEGRALAPFTHSELDRRSGTVAGHESYETASGLLQNRSTSAVAPQQARSHAAPIFSGRPLLRDSQAAVITGEPLSSSRPQAQQVSSGLLTVARPELQANPRVTVSAAQAAFQDFVLPVEHRVAVHNCSSRPPEMHTGGIALPGLGLQARAIQDSRHQPDGQDPQSSICTSRCSPLSEHDRSHSASPRSPCYEHESSGFASPCSSYSRDSAPPSSASYSAGSAPS